MTVKDKGKAKDPHDKSRAKPTEESSLAPLVPSSRSNEMALDPDVDDDVDPDEDFEDQGDGGQDDAQATQTASTLQFTSLDARLLSSKSVVQARITKLLKASPNGLHALTNFLVAIVSPSWLGFSMVFVSCRRSAPLTIACSLSHICCLHSKGCTRPSRQDRRFFITRVKEGISDGLWEKVWVPRPMQNGRQPRPTLCLRLMEHEGEGVDNTTQIEGEGEVTTGDSEIIETSHKLGKEDTSPSLLEDGV